MGAAFFVADRVAVIRKILLKRRNQNVNQRLAPFILWRSLPGNLPVLPELLFLRVVAHGRQARF